MEVLGSAIIFRVEGVFNLVEFADSPVNRITNLLMATPPYLQIA